jgi:hypothetical protein
VSKPRRVRWECPSGLHPGVLGSTRPPRDSIVRYCLPCSEERGRLVERLAPALEKRRAVQADRSAEKRKARETRERERARAKRTIAGVDLEAETRRLLRLKVFAPLARRGMPEIKVRRRTMHASAYGWAWTWENRIQINDYPGCDAFDVRETLCHELVHLLTRHSCDQPHDDHFHSKMSECFEAAYGVLPLGARENRYHGRYADALRIHEKSPEEKAALVADLRRRAEEADDDADGRAMRKALLLRASVIEMRGRDQEKRVRARTKRACNGGDACCNN